MFMNVYVNNQKELNQKVQEYSMMGYKVDNLGSDFASVKKKNYNMGILIILLFFGLILGILYYFLCDDDKINIQIDPSQAGNSQNQTNPSQINNIQTQSNTDFEVINSNYNNFCQECGTQLTSADNFCPVCGTKIE